MVDFCEEQEEKAIRILNQPCAAGQLVSSYKSIQRQGKIKCIAYCLQNF